jgi:flagellar motor switch protein FliN
MNTDKESALCAANEADLHAWRDFLDLSLELAVELGRTKLTAREILALEPNSIVKLSRSTGEGVDLVAGHNRIARGEVILIEDHTGVRINEVIAEEYR